MRLRGKIYCTKYTMCNVVVLWRHDYMQRGIHHLDRGGCARRRSTVWDWRRYQRRLKWCCCRCRCRGRCRWRQHCWQRSIWRGVAIGRSCWHRATTCNPLVLLPPGRRVFFKHFWYWQVGRGVTCLWTKPSQYKDRGWVVVQERQLLTFLVWDSRRRTCNFCKNH